MHSKIKIEDDLECFAIDPSIRGKLKNKTTPQSKDS